MAIRIDYFLRLVEIYVHCMLYMESARQMRYTCIWLKGTGIECCYMDICGINDHTTPLQEKAIFVRLSRYYMRNAVSVHGIYEFLNYI